MDKITGKSNSLIKDTKKLFTSSKERREKQRFVLEGARLCFDVLNSFYKLHVFLSTESAMEKYPEQTKRMIDRAEHSYIISQEIANSLSDTQSPQGVFCVCGIPAQNPSIRKGKYIALDCVQDPSNMGAIIRSAEALGVDGVISAKGCDIYNPKVLRASMGGVLRVPITLCEDLRQELLVCKAKGFHVYGTVPNENAHSVSNIAFQPPAVCVIGNEANGITAEVIDVCNTLVTIPMNGRAESLNASAAAAIVMWEMVR